jgi:lipopolysaccharide/colanic/teichoic acid biosynthesis glycosyltransferase
MTGTSNKTVPAGTPPGVAGGVPLWKRVLDVTCILIAIPLLLPLMLVIALIVKFGSRGPVLFQQERVGLRGTRFTCLKFRTMFVGADVSVHQGHWNDLIVSNRPMEKMDSRGDPRLIPMGRIMRETALDELPQIINVLRGEMSLVGPRPCIPYEYEKYLPWQKERFDTLPGLTGLWQVSGKNKTTFTEMMHLDIDYVRRKSLWMDIWIILMTIPALVIQVQGMRNKKRHAAAHSVSTGGGRPIPEKQSVGVK